MAIMRNPRETVNLTNVQRIREARGMSRRELADKVGITQSSVWGWETGATSTNLAVLLRVADVLDCTTDELLGRKNQKNQENQEEIA